MSVRQVRAYVLSVRRSPRVVSPRAYLVYGLSTITGSRLDRAYSLKTTVIDHPKYDFARHCIGSDDNRDLLLLFWIFFFHPPVSSLPASAPRTRRSLFYRVFGHLPFDRSSSSLDARRRRGIKTPQKPISLQSCACTSVST